ncbi:hypothetical protein EJB05_36790, partial [Eragrostis curvula]
MACPTSLLPAAPPFFVPSPCVRRLHLSPAARPFQPSPPSPRVVMVRWTPPPFGWFKINFDGSVYNDGSGRASIGGVIRDSTGRVVRGEDGALHGGHRGGAGAAAGAGAGTGHAAARRGHADASPRGDAAGDRRLTPVLPRARRRVQHVYREGNMVAHTLCRQAYVYPGVWAGAFVPSVVWAKAEDDRRGAAHKRAVVRAA